MKRSLFAFLLTAVCFGTSAQSPTCNIPAVIAAFNSQGYLQLNVNGQSCSLYFYNSNSTPNWQTAQDDAAALGANLASIGSQAENDSVVAAAQRAGLSGGVWIGFTDAANEGTWVWTDGNTSAYTNWVGGEPSNSPGVPCYNDEDGAVLQLTSGRWNDLALNNGCPFSTAFASIIKVNLCPAVSATSFPQPVCLTQPGNLNASTLFGSQPFTYTWVDAATQTQVGTGANISFPVNAPGTYVVSSVDAYGCSDTASVNVTAQTCQLPTCNVSQVDAVMSAQGYLYLNVQGQPCARYYYNSNATPNWQTAQDQAAAVGANLLSISDAAENTAVLGAAQAAGLSGGVWIGYTDAASEGNWVWADGNLSAYTNWNSGEPSNSSGSICYPDEDGAVLQLSNGRWNDLALNNSCPFSTAFASIIKVNLCPEVSAVAQPNPVCETLPVNLNATTLFGSQPFTYTWRDAATQAQVGTGAAISFPANAPGTYEVTLVDAYGCSDTASVSFTTQVCQLPTCDVAQVDALMAQQGFTYLNVQTEPCGRYFFNPSTTSNWNTANSQATAVGATLLTIRDQAENDAVWQAAFAAGVSGGLWIGYTDRATEGTWRWEDGSSSTFTNWNSGEPNNTSDICSGSGEDAAIMQMNNGRWNDVYINPGFPCLFPASYASLIKVNLCPQVTVNDANICAGNSATLTATTILGSTPYSYSWSTTETANPISVSPAATTDYSVTVTDRWGCGDADTSTVAVANTAQPVLNVNPANVCENAPVSISVTGNYSGTAVYNWTFDGGTIISGSGAGPYQIQWATAGTKNISLTIMDGACSSTPGTASVTVSPVPIADAGGDATICSGGSAFLGSVTLPGYAYQWGPTTGLSDSSIANPVFTATNTGTSPVTTTFVLLAAIGGCFDFDTVNVTVNPPASITLIPDGPLVFCGGDSVTLSVAGSYSTYNWSTGANTPTIAITQTFSYSLTAIDANGCEFVSDTIAVNASGAGPVIQLDSSRNITCAGLINGYLEISASGGAPTYSYSWSTLPVQTNPAISNLAAGSYTVSVSDQNSCVTTAQYLITAPTPVAISLDSIVDENCSGSGDGSISITASGGTPQYTYAWNTIPAQNASTAVDLISGTYTVTATDQNGCTASNQYSVATLPSTLAVTLDSVADASCHDSNDGGIQVSASGGTPQYTYRWNTNPQQFASTAINLTAGNYIVTVTDQNGCMVSGQYTVGAPPPLTIVLDSSGNVTCHDFSDGYLVCRADAGGLFEFTWVWSNGGSANAITNLAEGNYCVTMTDDTTGCSVDSCFDITGPPPLSFTVIPHDTAILEGGSFTYATSPSNLNYTWSPSTHLSCSDCISPLATPLDSIAYLVTVVDANGCEAFDTVRITILENRILAIPNAFSPNGDGNNDVFRILSDENFELVEMKIFNRWGELVFVSDNSSTGWDGYYKGVIQDVGVFVYVVQVRDLLNNGRLRTEKGSVTLVR